MTVQIRAITRVWTPLNMVAMKAAHRGEVSGESLAVSCLQLLDEGLTLASMTSFAALPWGKRGGCDAGLRCCSWCFLSLVLAFARPR